LVNDDHFFIVSLHHIFIMTLSFSLCLSFISNQPLIFMHLNQFDNILKLFGVIAFLVDFAIDTDVNGCPFLRNS
jgi:hypothetical protein